LPPVAIYISSGLIFKAVIFSLWILNIYICSPFFMFHNFNSPFSAALNSLYLLALRLKTSNELTASECPLNLLISYKIIKRKYNYKHV